MLRSLHHLDAALALVGEEALHPLPTLRETDRRAALREEATQIEAERAGVRVAVVGVAREGPEHDRVEARRHPLAHRGGRGDLVEEHRRERRGVRVAPEEALEREALPQAHTQAPDVGATVEVFVAHLLG